MSFNGLTIFDIVNEYNFFRVFTLSYWDCFLEFSLFLMSVLFPSLFSTSGTLTFIRLPWCGGVPWPLFIDRGILLNQSWKILQKYSRKSFLSRATAAGISHCADRCCCCIVCLPVCVDLYVLVCVLWLGRGQ